MTFDPALAPGCYGSALGFKETQPECQACIFASQCQPLQRANLEAMRLRYGIQVPVRKAQKALADSTTFTTGGVPKKVRELMDKVEEFGISVASIADGINPFRGRGFKHLALATHFAMNRKDGVSLNEFQTALAKSTGNVEETCNSQARIALQALAAMGAGSFEENVFKLKRAS